MIFPGCTHTSSTFKDAHFAQANQRLQHIEHLEDQITELAAHIHAATFRLLELLREYDEREGWGGKGLISCAHWLNWKCGIDMGTAREKVRVAHALKELPQISEAFRHGQVSYSKVRAMTRVATPKNEDYLLMIAQHGTAVHVERLVRNYRRVKRIEALEKENTRHAQRELHWNVDDEGYWVLRGRLTAEQGALVQAVMEQAMEEDFREQRGVPAGISSTEAVDEIHPHPHPVALRRADALVPWRRAIQEMRIATAEIASGCMCIPTWKHSSPMDLMARPNWKMVAQWQRKLPGVFPVMPDRASA